MTRILVLDYDSHPWDDIFTAIAIEHQLDDAYWQVRNISDRLKDIEIPLYLGADWDNVGVHLTTPFAALNQLRWETMPRRHHTTLAGPLLLHLEASSTATDVDWIVKVSDVASDGTVRDLTQGWLRASHRAVDPVRSQPRVPSHPHTSPQPLTPGQRTSFEIAIVHTAHRCEAGHCLRLAVTSDDTRGFAMQHLSHYPLGSPARNRIYSTSRLTIPVIPEVT